MTLALFDLDHTLIGGDSDVLWGKFLGERGHVDADHQEREQQRFFADYQAGRLDIHAFLRFQLRFLAEHDLEMLYRLRDEFIREKIHGVILPRARALLQKHRDQGHTLLIITATNRFITEPIARLLGVEELIATEPEMLNGRYSGGVVGEPSFAHGKVLRLEDWLEQHGETLEGSWFYSDSHNDLPLLSRVAHPVAVDPDERLAAEAARRHWPIISLR